jgi:hypothetical protein
MVMETSSRPRLCFLSICRLAAIVTAATLIVLPAAAQRQSDRERDGLAGSVREVRLFLGFVEPEDGTYREPDRRFFDTAVWYNRKGKKTKEKLPERCGNSLPWKPIYDNSGKLVEEDILNEDGNGLSGKVTYTYDSNGLVARSDEYDGKGVLHRTWTYSYQYDAHGNWIHQVLSMQDAKPPDGNTRVVPREVYYREISYY